MSSAKGLVCLNSSAQLRKRPSLSALLLAATAAPVTAPAQVVAQIVASTSTDAALPDAPLPQAAGAQPAAHGSGSAPAKDPSLQGTPKRIIVDELHIITSPARIRSRDLVWLLPVAGATAVSLSTDTKTMRDVVSHDVGFNSSATTASDVLRGVFIGAPVAIFGAGELVGNAKAREAGLLAGEAMVNGYVTSEGIKYITLRERPNLQNARGHFFQGDAVSDPSFVSGHSIVAWSSAAVLASEYSKPWQQIGIYTLASGASLTRVLGQNHFPTDVLLGSVSGWLIGRYVYHSHHNRLTH